ncbi:MAG: HAD-IIB family hydrolase [Acholeplasmataceae bacterium]|nr:HAD-IIB family hydrolase [Acholeplasmataceae bacterium]
MKTIIFFDVDNTIYNNNLGKIPEQTKKLLLELSKRDDVILGLATGRGYKKLEVIQEVVSFFKYKVLLNGSIIYKDDQVIYDHPILHEDIEEALSIAKGHQFNIGMVGLDEEAVNAWDSCVEDGMKQLRGKTPNVDCNFHNKNKVYQFLVIWR